MLNRITVLSVFVMLVLFCPLEVLGQRTLPKTNDNEPKKDENSSDTSLPKKAVPASDKKENEASKKPEKPTILVKPIEKKTAKPKSNRATANNGANEQAISEVEKYTLKIKKDPTNKENYLFRATARNQKGDYDGAIADYEKVITLDPENKSSYIRELASIYNNRGYDKEIGVYMNQKVADYEGAINDYTKAVEIDSSYQGAYINRANAKKEKGDYEGAISDYTKAIEINSKNVIAGVYASRANAKSQKNDFEGAVSDYSKAIELDSEIAEFYKNRAAAYNKLGKTKNAEQDIKKAEELKSK